MELNWREIDRWIFGEAWTGSQIGEHVEVLCEHIGPRWASSEGERQAVEYLREQFAQAGLTDAALEEFALNTWSYEPSRGNGRRIWKSTSCPIIAVHRATSKPGSSMRAMAQSTKSTGCAASSKEASPSCT